MRTFRGKVNVPVFVLQTAAVWSFDWPPAARTASWKYGLFPSMKEQVGRPHCPPPSTESSLTPSPLRKRGGGDPLTALTLKSLCRIEDFISVCGINQLQTDSLIMDRFKTFCWNTAEGRVWRRVSEEIRCIYPLWHLYLVRPAAEQEHFLYTRSLRNQPADCIPS